MRIAFAVVLVLGLCPGLTRADPAPRVALAGFQGARGRSAEKKLARRVVEAGGAVIGHAQIASAVGALRHAAPNREELAQFAETLNVAVWIDAAIRPRHVYRLRVRDASTGATLDTLDWRPGKGERALVGKLTLALRSAKSASPPPAVEPEENAVVPERTPPVPEPKAAPAPQAPPPASARELGDDTASADEEVPRAAGAHLSALEASVGPRFFSRSLSYSGDVNGAMRPYSAGAAMALGLHLEWFPGAHLTQGPGAWVGIAGDGEAVVALQSEAADGTRYATQALAFSGALVVRIPVGILQLRPTVGYGIQKFEVGSGGSEPVPAVSYGYVRAGLGLRLAIGDQASVELDGAYRAVGSLGAIGASPYFPHASASGFDLGLVGGYAFTPKVGLEARVELRRYGLSFDPQPGEGLQVASAVDRYLAATLGLRVTL